MDELFGAPTKDALKYVEDPGHANQHAHEIDEEKGIQNVHVERAESGT